MIQVNCHCGAEFPVLDTYHGRAVRCPKCGGAVLVDATHMGGRPAPVPAAPNPTFTTHANASAAGNARIQFPCPHCNTLLEVEPTLAGEEVTCSACAEHAIVPVRRNTSRPATPLYTSSVGPVPSAQLDPYGHSASFRCPYCQCTTPPIVLQQISTAGWVVFAVMMVMCFPLFWIGLLIKDTHRICSSCGMRLC